MSLDSRRLLIVDDEIEICNFVTAFFQQRGFSVYQANDGEEALKVAGDKKPQIVLLDVRMKGGEDGFEVLPKIKKILPNSKILMVTGVEDEASAERSKESCEGVVEGEMTHRLNEAVHEMYLRYPRDVTYTVKITSLNL